MSQYRVVVTDDRFDGYDEENSVFAHIGCRVEVHDLGNEEETLEVLREADAVLLNLHPLPSSIVSRLTRCRVISRYGVGFDNVDVAAATARGIWVANVPDYARNEVAEHALALLLCCERMVAWRDRRIRSGNWGLGRGQPSYRIQGKTLGLVGFGAIGRTFHAKTAGLGFSRTLVFDPYVPADVVSAAGAEHVPMEDLLRNSDFLSLHVSLTQETRKLIGPRELAMVKPGAVIVNTSRGGVVDEAALAQAIRSGVVRAAGLDVFEAEPLPRESELLRLDRVVLTDHAAFYSEESIHDLKTKAALNVLAVLEGAAPPYPVNRLP
jgi:D-3-phosphoglycerate dehydrogenase / 2-oxoglutarate reductase